MLLIPLLTAERLADAVFGRTACAVSLHSILKNEAVRMTNANTSEALPVNRTFKSTLFIMLFEDKKNLLELYNAITGKHYADPELLEINTLCGFCFTFRICIPG